MWPGVALISPPDVREVVSMTATMKICTMYHFFVKMFISTSSRGKAAEWEGKRRTCRAKRNSHQDDKSLKTPEILHVPDPGQALPEVGLASINGTKRDRCVRKRIACAASGSQIGATWESQQIEVWESLRSPRQQWDSGSHGTESRLAT